MVDTMNVAKTEKSKLVILEKKNLRYFKVRLLVPFFREYMHEIGEEVLVQGYSQEDIDPNKFEFVKDMGLVTDWLSREKDDEEKQEKKRAVERAENKRKFMNERKDND